MPAISIAGVVTLPEFPLLIEHPNVDAAEVHHHVASTAARRVVDRDAGALNGERALVFAFRREVESVR